MLAGFLTIAILQTLAVISPGPDFAMVVKNTLSHSRRTGIITTLGIVSGVMFHLSYCLLGLAVIISQSLLLFSIIKYLGACYLIYIGLKSVFSRNQQSTPSIAHMDNAFSFAQAFRQGLLCNVLNPKAALFFMGLFTLVINPHTPFSIQLGYAIEITFITFIWFTFLAMLLTHTRIQKGLNRLQNVINKVIGTLLVIFGTELAFLQWR